MAVEISKTELMGNQEFGLLIQEHTRPLKAFAFSFTRNTDDAEDLYQDTILKAINYFHHFKKGTNVKAWLFTIMRNTFINDYRRQVRRGALVVIKTELTSEDLSGSSSENKAVGNLVLKDIERMLRLLSPSYLQPFQMHFEGYKYHEIADELQIPIGTVKTRIHIARELLKRQLRPYAHS
jgi:RNA polymerase sigma factor (sigma-70 family)